MALLTHELFLLYIILAFLLGIVISLRRLYALERSIKRLEMIIARKAIKKSKKRKR